MREDLYYRLRVVPITCRRCVERPEDVPAARDYFLSTYWSPSPEGRAVPSLDRCGAARPVRLQLAGNVRELQNVIEHVPCRGTGRRDSGRGFASHGRCRGAGDGRAIPPSLISTLLEESYHAARDRVIAQSSGST